MHVNLFIFGDKSRFKQTNLVTFGGSGTGEVAAKTDEGVRHPFVIDAVRLRVACPGLTPTSEHCLNLNPWHTYPSI